MAQNPLTIVVPVYNEDKSIRKLIDEVRRKVKTPCDIHIIYDDEQDTTLPVVRSLPDRTNIRLVRNNYGRGALNAIRTGMETAPGEMVLVTMADLSDDMADIDKMVAKSREGYAVVCGSRYMRGGRQIGGPRLKKLMSRTAGLILHYIAGISTLDATNSFKLYHKTFLESVTIESNGGFELGLELVVKAHKLGCRVAEIPTIWRDRVKGESRFRLLQWLPNYLRWFFAAFGRRK